MKHLKTFGKYHSTNEELIGLGALALAGLVLASDIIYRKAKEFWFNKLRKKYQPTGEIQKVDVINRGVPSIAVVKQYEDEDGDLYWGFDHQYNSEGDYQMTSGDIYTAIYQLQDLKRLKKYLRGEKIQSSIPEYDYLDAPKPVDMIYRHSIQDPSQAARK